MGFLQIAQVTRTFSPDAKAFRIRTFPALVLKVCLKGSSYTTLGRGTIIWCLAGFFTTDLGDDIGFVVLKEHSNLMLSTKAGNYIGNKKQRYFVLFRDGESIRVQLVKTERRSCYGLRLG